MSGSDKLNRWVVAGGAVFSGLALGLYYLYKKETNDHLELKNKYPKQMVIQILTELRNSLNELNDIIFRSILAEKLKLAKRGVPLTEDIQEQLKEMVMSEENKIFYRMGVLEERVYQKFGLESKQQFEVLCLNTYGQEKDIMDLMNAIREDFNGALSGKSPPNNEVLPEHFTEDLLIEIEWALKMAMINAFVAVADEFADKDLAVFEVGREFAKKTDQIDFLKLRQEIFEKYEFSKYTNRADALMAKGRATFSKSRRFLLKISEVDFRMNVIISTIKSGQFGKKVIESIFEEFDAISAKVNEILADEEKTGIPTYMEINHIVRMVSDELHQKEIEKNKTAGLSLVPDIRIPEEGMKFIASSPPLRNENEETIAMEERKDEEGLKEVPPIERIVAQQILAEPEQFK